MSGQRVIIADAARFFAPFVVLFAASLLFERAAGTGVGFVAGLVASLLLILHVVVYGAEAARRAAAPLVLRLALSAGICLGVAGFGAPALAYAPQLAEAGAFLTTSAGIGLAFLAIAGRAATLRTEAR